MDISGPYPLQNLIQIFFLSIILLEIRIANVYADLVCEAMLDEVQSLFCHDTNYKNDENDHSCIGRQLNSSIISSATNATLNKRLAASTSSTSSPLFRNGNRISRQTVISNQSSIPPGVEIDHNLDQDLHRHEAGAMENDEEIAEIIDSSTPQHDFIDLTSLENVQTSPNIRSNENSNKKGRFGFLSNTPPANKPVNATIDNHTNTPCSGTYISE